MSENNSCVITKAVNMRVSDVNFLAAPNYTVYMFNETRLFPLHLGRKLEYVSLYKSKQYFKKLQLIEKGFD